MLLSNTFEQHVELGQFIRAFDSFFGKRPPEVHPIITILGVVIDGLFLAVDLPSFVVTVHSRPVLVVGSEGFLEFFFRRETVRLVVRNEPTEWEHEEGNTAQQPTEYKSDGGVGEATVVGDGLEGSKVVDEDGEHRDGHEENEAKRPVEAQLDAHHEAHVAHEVGMAIDPENGDSLKHSDDVDDETSPKEINEVQHPLSTRSDKY